MTPSRGHEDTGVVVRYSDDQTHDWLFKCFSENFSGFFLNSRVYPSLDGKNHLFNFLLGDRQIDQYESPCTRELQGKKTNYYYRCLSSRTIPIETT